MLTLRTALLLLALLLASGGEAQVCKPQLQGILRNLALRRPAFQSSTYPHETNPVAGKAVDGNCGGDFDRYGSCTHTNQDQNAWWYVDLGLVYDISAVIVKNREDCCGERLKGAQIYVGNSAPHLGKGSTYCGTITDTSLGSISTISCHWHRGRYVSIRILGRSEFLTLCEVEVYGVKCF